MTATANQTGTQCAQMFTADALDNVYDVLQNDEELDPWSQIKLTHATDSLRNALTCLAYDKRPVPDVLFSASKPAPVPSPSPKPPAATVAPLEPIRQAQVALPVKHEPSAPDLDDLPNATPRNIDVAGDQRKVDNVTIAFNQREMANASGYGADTTPTPATETQDAMVPQTDTTNIVEQHAEQSPENTPAIHPEDEFPFAEDMIGEWLTEEPDNDPGYVDNDDEAFDDDDPNMFFISDDESDSLDDYDLDPENFYDPSAMEGLFDEEEEQQRPKEQQVREQEKAEHHMNATNPAEAVCDPQGYPSIARPSDNDMINSKLAEYDSE